MTKDNGAGGNQGGPTDPGYPPQPDPRQRLKNPVQGREDRMNQGLAFYTGLSSKDYNCPLSGHTDVCPRTRADTWVRLYKKIFLTAAGY